MLYSTPGLVGWIKLKYKLGLCWSNIWMTIWTNGSTDLVGQMCLTADSQSVASGSHSASDWFVNELQERLDWCDGLWEQAKTVPNIHALNTIISSQIFDSSLKKIFPRSFTPKNREVGNVFPQTGDQTKPWTWLCKGFTSACEMWDAQCGEDYALVYFKKSVWTLGHTPSTRECGQRLVTSLF